MDLATGVVARRRRILAAAAALAVMASAVPVAAHSNPSGFKTSANPMLFGASPGIEIEALLTVGEQLPGGFRFEAIPDGIAVKARGNGRLDVYVNHETSTVPFPYNAAAPTTANSANDFDNATLSRIVLNQHGGGVLSAKQVIGSDANWQRFCSSYLGTAAEGFDRDLLFLNEEATDFVYRSGTAWPTTPGDPAADQAGRVVVYDIRTGASRDVPGMGRHNHENSVAIPGYDELMLLSGDDTFTPNPAGSQVYAYFAADADAIWNDEGALFGFRATDSATYNDYYDFPIDSGLSIEGEFVEIPRAAAIGNQAALEAASDAAGVFQFVRVEDIAYDRNDPHIVYLADSGRASTSTSGNAFASRNGRVWKMVLDPAEPRHVLSLSVLIDGDGLPLVSENGPASLAAIHQPDNLETTEHGLFITEDPSTANKYAITNPDGTGARVWWYHLDGPLAGTREVVLRVDQAADEGPTDRDPNTSRAANGDWEASGIVDVSAVFGPGAFLVDVQAHSLWIEIANGPDLLAPAGPDWLYKREGGQLLLVRIPGA